MAPKVTKSNNSTTVKPTTVKKKPTPKKIDIAKAMMQFAEQNSGAIGKEGFQALLKQVNKGNVIDVIKQYDKISPNKSIIAMILGETGSNDEEMESALTGKGNGKTAVRGLFTLLLDKAKDVGVDSKTIETYKKEFEKELDAQLGNNSILGQIRSLVYTDSSKLDTIMRALVQTIDNQTQLSTDEKVKISNTPATKMQAETTNVLVKRYNTALKNFNEQLKQDGWAGDVADGFSKIWNNDVGDFLGISTGNTADRVRKDLNACKKDLDALKQARQQGDAAYRAKFQEIFKVAYNPANIVAYQKAEERYIEATKAKAQEDSFKSQFSLLLNAKNLREEGTNMISPTTGGGTYMVTATKDQVFQREEKKLLDLMGEGGKALLESKYKEAGAKTNDEKFKVLQTLTKAVATKLGNDTKLACGGVSYDSVQRQFDNCYKAAYGLENDIMKRVNDYNISQQKGAGVVKGAVVMTVVTACALTGQVEGIVAVAGVAAGTTAVVEVTDAASQKRNIDAFKKGGLGAYLKSVGENTDWGGIAKASLTSGAMMLAIGGASYPIANLCRISASAAGLTGKALDIATGLGTNAAITGGVLGSQYLMKGEITTEDAVFAVVMAVVGSTIQVIQINKAYAASESAAVDAHIQNIQNARRTLGFEDGVEITPDMLKQQYKKMALANHPDRGGSNVNMAVINSANEFLQAHIADINISLTGARPQTINPTIEAAKGNTSPQTNPADETGIVKVETDMQQTELNVTNTATTPQEILSNTAAKQTSGTKKPYTEPEIEETGVIVQNHIASSETDRIASSQAQPWYKRAVSKVGKVLGISSDIEPVQTNVHQIYNGMTLTKNEPVVVPSSTTFTLAESYEFDMNDPSVKAKLDRLQPGQSLIVGRMGDIETPAGNRAVSRYHLVIEKVDNNQFKVTDISSFGTKINQVQASNASSEIVQVEPVQSNVHEIYSGMTLTKNEPVIVPSSTTFTLAESYEFDMNDPSVKAKLDKLQPGQSLVVGRMGDIETPAGNRAVSRYHLVIEKVDNNQFKVTDISSFGTKINKVQANNNSKQEIKLYDSLEKVHRNFVDNRPDLFGRMEPSYGTVWMQYDAKDKHHGPWKMHLFSVEESDWQKMCEVVVPYLNAHDVEWKTLNANYDPSYLNDSKQRGKAFTVYPKNNEDFAQIAKDLDKLIRENNLMIGDSHITGDNQLGGTGRLFYRYEFNSGKYLNHVLDLADADTYDFYRQIYESNRGEGRYLAYDMTPEDDPWPHLDLSDPESIQRFDYAGPVNYDDYNGAEVILDYTGEHNVDLPKYEPVIVNENAILVMAGRHTLDLTNPSVKSVLDNLKPGESITVGREGDIFIRDVHNNVSRKHLIIEKIGSNEYKITDTSLNGTRLI